MTLEMKFSVYICSVEMENYLLSQISSLLARL